MISKRIPDVRGEVLQKAREAKGLSVAELASKVCFSVKQIEQLENGERSHFYSLAIKASAAKRVADELGIEHEDVFDFGPDLVEAAKAPQKLSTEPVETSEVHEGLTNSHASTDKTEPDSKGASLKKNVENKVEQLERFENTAEPIVKKNRNLYFVGGAAVIAAIGLVVINASQSPIPIKPTEVAKLPSETISNLAEPKKEESVAASASVNQTSPAAVAVTGGAANTSSTTADGCPVLDPSGAVYRSPVATKLGNMVHVQSRAAQIVCVKDASGKLERKSLEAGGSYSFYGKAPFVVMTSGLGQTDLFFQGYKVRIDNPNAKSITLEEVAF